LAKNRIYTNNADFLIVGVIAWGVEKLASEKSPKFDRVRMLCLRLSLFG
jgi:hypothetical protein